MCSGSDFFLGVLAIFFPPIAVWIKRGICTADSLINITLCCLAYLPGLLHAWYILSTHPEPDYAAVPQQPDSEAGHPPPWHASPQPRPRGRPACEPSYGTMSAPGAGQFPGQEQGGSGNYYVPKGVGRGGEGEGQVVAAAAAPPSYSEVVKGDFKVQNRD